MSRLRLFSLLLVLLALAGCQVESNNSTRSSSSAPNASGDGKIAISTKSEEARKEFLAGRDLSEKLRITDSIQHYDKAIALDPNFALAHLNRANASPTATEFFEHLKHAVTHAAEVNRALLSFLAEQGGEPTPGTG